jgi:hypothetical protein
MKITCDEKTTPPPFHDPMSGKMGNYQTVIKRQANSKASSHEKRNSTMGSTSSGSPAVEEMEPVAVRVDALLDKRPIRELIYI